MMPMMANPIAATIAPANMPLNMAYSDHMIPTSVVVSANVANAANPTTKLQMLRAFI